ncbi:MAG TPA: BON domain-containing protein [Candidatus Polarisedimenticolia bacterium]|jgi:osmotically-inducible protein OsmY|nr:BON domain-containing protein [Candidatus Polarisedimenticolia bacterium]
MNRRLGYWLGAFALAGVLAWGCAGTDQPAEQSRTAGDAIHDASITASVKIALALKPGVAATDINVDTNRGIVTLRGEVRTEAERQLAVMVAEDIESVREVVNELTVHG